MKERLEIYFTVVAEWAECNFDQVRTGAVYCYRRQPRAAVTNSTDVNSAQMRQLHSLYTFMLYNSFFTKLSLSSRISYIWSGRFIKQNSHKFTLLRYEHIKVKSSQGTIYGTIKAFSQKVNWGGRTSKESTISRNEADSYKGVVTGWHTGCPEIPTVFTTFGDKGTAGKSEGHKVDQEMAVSIR